MRVIPRAGAFTVMIFMLWICVWLTAAPLRDMPIRITQPDGAMIDCYTSGDEYHNWLHDADGFTIIQSQETGYYTYAVKDGGRVGASEWIVGRDDPRAIGLEPRVNISEAEYNQRRATKFPVPETRNAPSTGTINNIVIYIRFSDQTEFGQSISTYEGWFNTNTSSQRSYFLEASYGQLTVNTTFYPAPQNNFVVSWQSPNPRSFYQPYNATTNPNGYSGDTQRRTREHALLRDAVNAVSPQIPANLNIDADNDGFVDNVVFIVRGATGGWSELLWPHRWVLWTYSVYIRGKQVYDYNFQLQDFLTGSNVGVICHEFYHTLGAPDLYRYYDSTINPVGSWDLMASNTNPPQHMGAYMKWKYGGWISSIPVISIHQTYTLNPVTSPTNNVYRINSPNSTSEYFIVEYRNKSGTYENQLPGSGLLIYRINTSAGNGNANGPPDEVYIYRPDGTLTVTGNLNSAHYSAQTGRINMNATTNPSPFLSNGNAGGLVINQIGSAGATITFRLGPPPTVDMAATGFSGPASGSVGNTYLYVVTVSNQGSETQSGYTVRLMQSGGLELDSIAGTALAPGASRQFTLNFNPSAAGNYILNGRVFATGDSNTGNDFTTTRSVRIIVVNETVLIGNGNQQARTPVDMYWKNSLNQFLLYPAEMYYGEAQIDGIRLYNNFVTNLPNKPVKIWLGTTTNQDLSAGWIPAGQLTSVFDGVVSFPSGQNVIDIIFDAPYQYLGGNLVMLFQRPMDSAYFSINDNFQAQTVGTNRTRRVQSDTTVYDPFNPPATSTLSGQFPRMQIMVDNPRYRYDLLAGTIVADAFPQIGVPQSIAFRITNEGSLPMADYSVQLFSADNVLLGGLPGIAIAAGVSIEHFFTWTPANIGNTGIYGKIVCAGDQNVSNNTSPILNLLVIDEDTSVSHLGDGSSTGRFPIDLAYANSLYETVFLADEIDHYGLLIGITLFNDFETEITGSPMRIWFGETGATDLAAGWIPSSFLQQVFDGSIDFPAGQNIVLIPFQSPFYYRQQNLVMMINRPFDSTTNLNCVFQTQDFANFRGRNRSSNSYVYDPASPPTPNNAQRTKRYPRIGFLFQQLNALEPPMITGFNRSGNNIQLSWTPVPYAHHYKIYIATKPDGDYQHIATEQTTALILEQNMIQNLGDGEYAGKAFIRIKAFLNPD